MYPVPVPVATSCRQAGRRSQNIKLLLLTDFLIREIILLWLTIPNKNWPYTPDNLNGLTSPFMMHAFWLQFVDSDEDPWHAAPPFSACSLTALVRSWVPPPHVAVHDSHCPQVPHWQSTVMRGQWEKMYNYSIRNLSYFGLLFPTKIDPTTQITLTV